MSTDSNPSSTDLAKDAAPDIAGKTESEPDATTESGIQSSEVPAVPATEGGLEGRDSQASNDTDVPVEEGKEGDAPVDIPVDSGDAGEEDQEGRDSQDSQVSQAIPDEGAADATSTAVPPGFAYNSGSNPEFLDVEQIRALIREHVDPQFAPVK